jgi:cholestenol Delta-isomerase
MEGVTAFFVGPLCAAAAWAYAHGSAWRHVAALCASLCQLYGDVLYFATAAYERMAATRPEPLYVWFYFVFLNGIWVVLPGAVACHTVRALVAATGKAGGGGSGGATRSASKRR